MKELLFIIVPTLIFVSVLLLIAAADRIADRLFGSKPGKRTRRRSIDRRFGPHRCTQCGNLFSDDLLLNGVCIYCRDQAETERIQQEMRSAWEMDRSGLEQYYRLLGCARTDSNEVVKRRYHDIVKRIHPDVLFQKGLSERVIRDKTEEFRNIQEAYEKIMENRKGSA